MSRCISEEFASVLSLPQQLQQESTKVFASHFAKIQEAAREFSKFFSSSCYLSAIGADSLAEIEAIELEATVLLTRFNDRISSFKADFDKLERDAMVQLYVASGLSQTRAIKRTDKELAYLANHYAMFIKTYADMEQVVEDALPRY